MNIIIITNIQISRFPTRYMVGGFRQQSTDTVSDTYIHCMQIRVFSQKELVETLGVFNNILEFLCDKGAAIPACII